MYDFHGENLPIPKSILNRFSIREYKVFELKGPGLSAQMDELIYIPGYYYEWKEFKNHRCCT